jgi:hypothetical protein
MTSLSPLATQSPSGSQNQIVSLDRLRNVVSHWSQVFSTPGSLGDKYATISKLILSGPPMAGNGIAAIEQNPTDNSIIAFGNYQGPNQILYGVILTATQYQGVWYYTTQIYQVLQSCFGNQNGIIGCLGGSNQPITPIGPPIGPIIPVNPNGPYRGPYQGPSQPICGGTTNGICPNGQSCSLSPSGNYTCQTNQAPYNPYGPYGPYNKPTGFGSLIAPVKQFFNNLNPNRVR